MDAGATRTHMGSRRREWWVQRQMRSGTMMEKYLVKLGDTPIEPPIGV
jgi:hypothetical protein